MDPIQGSQFRQISKNLHWLKFKGHAGSLEVAVRQENENA